MRRITTAFILITAMAVPLGAQRPERTNSARADSPFRHLPGLVQRPCAGAAARADELQ